MSTYIYIYIKKIKYISMVCIVIRIQGSAYGKRGNCILYIYIYIYIVSAHNEELKCLYSSPNIVRVIKSRRMRWGGMWPYWGRERSVQGAGGETRGEETAGET